MRITVDNLRHFILSVEAFKVLYDLFDPSLSRILGMMFVLLLIIIIGRRILLRGSFLRGRASICYWGGVWMLLAGAVILIVVVMIVTLVA